MSWYQPLAEALRRHGVPGASLSVYDGRETVEFYYRGRLARKTA